MKIIIVGVGKIGYALAQELSKEDHDIVIIDQQPSRVSHALNTLDVSALTGNGASIEILMEAEVGKADLLIAVTGIDELNLLCCLTAKKIGTRHTIARVRKPEYSRQIELMKDELGLSAIVNPEQGAAAEISRILRLPGAASVDTFSGGRVELVGFRVGQESILDGMPLLKFRERLGRNVLVCTAERGGVIQIPRGSYFIQAGDRLNVIGTSNDIYHFFHQINGQKRRIGRVMIVGGSRIAAYLTRALLSADMKVTLIEKNEERCQEIKSLLPQVEMVWGDGTQVEVLQEEGVEEMDAFVALTNSDEDNTIVSMYASSLGVEKVIIKVNEQHIIDLMENTPLDTFIQSKIICSERILQYVRTQQNIVGGSMNALYSLAGGRVEALGFDVLETSRCIGKPLKKLPIRKDVLIASISRGNTSFIPTGDDSMEAGDEVVVITLKLGMHELDDILTENNTVME